MASENRSQISVDELKNILSRINASTVGIKCSGICTVTYGFIANVRIIFIMRFWDESIYGSSILNSSF